MAHSSGSVRGCCSPSGPVAPPPPGHASRGGQEKAWRKLWPSNGPPVLFLRSRSVFCRALPGFAPSPGKVTMRVGDKLRGTWRSEQEPLAPLAPGVVRSIMPRPACGSVACFHLGRFCGCWRSRRCRERSWQRVERGELGAKRTGVLRGAGERVGSMGGQGREHRSLELASSLHPQLPPPKDIPGICV